MLLTPYCQQQGSCDCLVSTAVHGAQVVGGTQNEPHDKGEKAVGFMVSTTTGTWGGVSGLKNRMSLAYGPFGGTRSVHVLDCLCPGMVLTVCE